MIRNVVRGLCPILLTGLLAPGAVAETVSRTLGVNPGDVGRQVADGVVSLTLTGAASGFRSGEPDLPVVSVFLRLPPGTRATGVRLVPLESVPLPPVASVAAVPVDEGPRAAASSTLLPAGVFPPDPVLSYHTGRMRGRPVAAVAVSPFRWDPASGELTLISSFRVDVDTEQAPPGRDDLVILRESPEGERTFGANLDDLTGADGSLRDRAPLRSYDGSSAFAPTFRPSLEGCPVEMVIITTADQAPEYQRLADFKTRIGVTTVVRTVDWIVQNYPQGVDTQETIRNFIKDAASKWGTVWFLLGGDSEPVPVRRAHTSWLGGTFLTTDLYYTDLDGNWNANGNDLFGEGVSAAGPGDAVDLFPDVWVGRLPSNNAAEAAVMVDKTLLYQQAPPLGYQNDLLLLGEVLFPDHWEQGQSYTLDGAQLCENVADSAGAGHRTVRLYENYTEYPGALPEFKQTVLDSMSAGFNLVHHTGHGFINTMSVGIDHQSLGNLDAESLTNGNELFMLYTVNCTSSSITYNCIGERFLANPMGGAVAVIGGTDLEEVLMAAQLQNSFYGKLYGEDVQEIGQTLPLAKIPFIAAADQDNWTRWGLMTLICLGDPNLHFWTDTPESLSVGFPPTVELGTGVFPVSVTRGGLPVAGARVALYKEGDSYAVGVTDALGSVSLGFSPDSTGTLSVGVFSPNSLPFLGTSTVVPPPAPYLFSPDYTVVDDGSAASDGNGDARMDAGETVALTFSLRNNGCVEETGITAVLSAGHPDVSIPDPSASFPDVSPGNAVVASDPILVSIDRGVPDLLEVAASLTITGTSGTYVQDLILYVHAPGPQYWLQTLRDTIGTGNGDGVIGGNEDFAILPHIRNTGHGSLRGGELRLRSTDPSVTVTDSVSVLGDILSGGVGVNPADGFGLRIADPTVPVDLQAVLLDAYGEVLTQALDITPPDTVTGPAGHGTSSAIDVRWNPVDDSDLGGYAIYRAENAGGPFVRLNSWVHRTSYYEDTGLPPLTRRYYRITAVDSSGNEGISSTVLSATTTLPLHVGWPVEVGTGTPGGMTIGDLDGDAELEVLGSGKAIYVVTPDGMDYYDGDLDARTLGPIFDSGGVTFQSTAAVGDVDGNGTSEIAQAGWEDGLLYLLDGTGDPLPGWPKDINQAGISAIQPIGSATLADLDLDGDLEVLLTVGKALFAWHHTGVELRDGDGDPGTDGILISTSRAFSYATPSAGNIDEEPNREIVTGMRDGNLYVFEHDGTAYPGFPFVTGGNITSSPALGDIDGDGRIEIVFASSDSMVYAIRNDLSSASGFPRQMPMIEDWDSSPALGDLNGDTYPDVVIGSSNGLLHAMSGLDGSDLPGFPIPLLDDLGDPVVTRSSPVLADVDADGGIDILIGDRAGRLHGFHATGQPLAGFPIQTQNRIQNAPLIWDIDSDGLVEVAVESKDQNMYVWDTPWTFDPSRAPWPMFKGNQQNTGMLSDPPVRGIQVGVSPTEPPHLLLQNYPNPFARSTSVRFLVPDGSGGAEVALEVFDLSGRLVRTLVRGPHPPGIFEISWDGRDSRGTRVAAGIYPYRVRVGESVDTRKMILLGR